MLIGVAGFKNAGKDTVGRYLVERYNFERFAFADILKKSVAALFDIPLEDIDKYKNDPQLMVAIGWENEPEKKFEGQPSKMWSPMKSMTFREFLKFYGTESHRDIFGFDFWLDQVLPQPGKNHQGWTTQKQFHQKQFHHNKRIVVTDVRFENEAKRIVDLVGYVVRVSRPGVGGEEHRSEIIGFPVDYELENDGTFVDLFKQVDKMMERWQ